MGNEHNGILGRIYLSAGTSTSFTKEAMTDSGDHLTYSITDLTKDRWDTLTPASVYVDDSIVLTGYTVNYDLGIVKFAVSQGSSTITVSGKYFATTSTAFTKETTTDSGSHLVYTITDTTKKYLDEDATTLVYVNDILVTTGFEIDYIGGIITFEASQGALPVTISGKYWNVVEVGGFFNWKLSVDISEIDVTKFGDNFKRKVLSIGDWSATAEKFYYNKRFISLMGNKMICAFYVDGVAGQRFEGSAFLKKNAIDISNTDVIKESLEFTGNGKIYHRM